MTAVSAEARTHARVLWGYHVVTDPLDTADFVLALGSHDERVAVQAAALVLMQLSPLFVSAGGKGKVTGALWDEAEAQRYAGIARQMGVPESAIVIEARSSNTGENITFVRDVFAERGETPTSGILVSKPYMARRARATARKQWPSIGWRVYPPPLSYDAYSSSEVPEDRMINLLVGDLQRMWLFAKQGFQVSEQVPDDVRRAYDVLVKLGFTQFVLPED
jgi:uncharacterized SAM-binding protein YcdF (DUF218 family)